MVAPSRLALFASGTIVGACALSHEPSAVATQTQATIYGQDDRQDLYQTEQPFARLSREIAIALMVSDKLQLREDGAYRASSSAIRVDRG